MKPRIEPIEWKKHYETGNHTVDGEHKKIFNMANKYIEDVNAGSGIVSSEKIIEAAHTYALEHFEREEELMASVNYSKMKLHKDCHTSFLLLLSKFKNQISRGEDVTYDVAYFLQTWLLTHVKEMDIEFESFFAKSK
ncbi:MAG: hemerythrin family protein [Rhodospirillaceae bacterium]